MFVFSIKFCDEEIVTSKSQIEVTMRFHPPLFCLPLVCESIINFLSEFGLLCWLVGHHHDHVHDSAVTSVSIVFEGVLDLDAVNCTWVSSLC